MCMPLFSALAGRDNIVLKYKDKCEAAYKVKSRVSLATPASHCSLCEAVLAGIPK
jgi:hypothetical protein